MTAPGLARRGVLLALLWGTYLVFAGQATTDEVVAGLGSALLATLLADRVVRTSERKLRFTADGWSRLIGTTLAKLPIETFRVGAILASAHPTEGCLQRSRYTERGSDAAARAGWRGAMALATSLTPNSFVIAILDPRHGFLLHRLAPPSASGD